jgi:hypothetical protein
MNRPHTDLHYYDCSHPDSHGRTTCSGKMEFWGHEPHGKKQAVYKCCVCGRVTGESMLLFAYNKMKRWD